MPSTVIRLMQVLESFSHRHEDGGLHSELASGPCAVDGAVGVVTGREGRCHGMVYIGHCLHDACCQGGYVQYGSHLHTLTHRSTMPVNRWSLLTYVPSRARLLTQAINSTWSEPVQSHNLKTMLETRLFVQTEALSCCYEQSGCKQHVTHLC